MIEQVPFLSWLPAAPEDFRLRCNAVENIAADSGSSLRSLAQHALNANQLNRLAKTAMAVGDKSEFLPLRLGLISNATTDIIEPALIGTALRYGILLDVVAAPFDQPMQEALDPNSTINAAAPDVVLLALDYRGIPIETGPQEALGHVHAICDGIAANCGAPVIVQNIPRSPEPLFGNLDPTLTSTHRSQVGNFNAELTSAVNTRPELLLDVAGLAETVGLSAWHDPVQWHLAKLSFSQDFVPIYAEHVCRLLAALRGRSRKCLVLDLDNTIWGGIIGDDGVDGIVLGNGSAPGEAFLAIQKTALALRDRGILLAVCSKNDERNAKMPFRSHPEMLLKEDHISVFQANWVDKATNLEAIARSLEFGIDALVFLDDNPAERAQVREALPDVAVPELPDDPALYPRVLQSAGYFEAISFSDEDKNRASQYQANAKRAELKETTRDLSSYLKSLEMEISILPFDAVSRSRIAQLVNKSNQFNLTGRRYTESEIEAIENDPSVHGFYARLVDRFGDNGIISVIICRSIAESWEVDTWVMSCRVLGRGVEQAMLNEIAHRAITDQKSKIIGTFIDSGRNHLVQHHFEKLGFSETKSDAESSHWALTLKNFVGQAVFITSSPNL